MMSFLDYYNGLKAALIASYRGESVRRLEKHADEVFTYSAKLIAFKNLQPLIEEYKAKNPDNARLISASYNVLLRKYSLEELSDFIGAYFQDKAQELAGVLLDNIIEIPLEAEHIALKPLYGTEVAKGKGDIECEIVVDTLSVVVYKACCLKENNTIANLSARPNEATAASAAMNDLSNLAVKLGFVPLITLRGEVEIPVCPFDLR